MTFEDEDISNVNENPLSNHGRPKVNAIESDQEMQMKRNVKDVCMPMKRLYEVLVKASRHREGFFSMRPVIEKEADEFLKRQK